MTVLFTPQAETLWLAALDYIRSDRPTAAIAFRDKVVKSLSRLEAFPQSGRLVPEYPDPSVREVIVSPYRFFYRIEVETVWVFAVWHEAQVPDDQD